MTEFGSAEGNGMIEVRGLTKRYGDTLAVDDLTFGVRPGYATGFNAERVGHERHGLMQHSRSASVGRCSSGRTHD